MLKLVDQNLQELGLMPGGAVSRYTINITAGESLAISVFVSDTLFFQVKASEFMDLGAQYEAYCRAWEDFQALVPHPLGLVARAPSLVAHDHYGDRCDRQCWPGSSGTGADR